MTAKRPPHAPSEAQSEIPPAVQAGTNQEIHRGERFTASFDAADKRVVVAIGETFATDDWREVLEIGRRQLKAGRIHWSVDLRSLPIVQSRLMGELIALNTVLDLRGGTLEVIVAADSTNATALRQGRLGKIMNIVEK
jgi:hypothetical protein